MMPGRGWACPLENILYNLPRIDHTKERVLIRDCRSHAAHAHALRGTTHARLLDNHARGGRDANLRKPKALS